MSDSEFIFAKYIILWIEFDRILSSVNKTIFVVNKRMEFNRISRGEKLMQNTTGLCFDICKPFAIHLLADWSRLVLLYALYVAPIVERIHIVHSYNLWTKSNNTFSTLSLSLSCFFFKLHSSHNIQSISCDFNLYIMRRAVIPWRLSKMCLTCVQHVASQQIFPKTYG